MEQEQSSVEKYEKFTWKVENFSRLKNKVYSERFVLGGYPWMILLFPRGNNVYNNLSLYLAAVNTDDMSHGWSIDAKFKLVVFNQLNTNKTIIKETSHKFNADRNDLGFASFMMLTELHDREKGYIVKDACIIGAEVLVSKSTQVKTVNLGESQKFGSQTDDMEAESPEPEITNHETDLSIVSNLVCNETSKISDTDLVSAALGKVIYFLKTRKVKDMNEQACEELEVLWDELKKFKFDITWLEPQVQYALGNTSYVEKALEVEKLKGNVEDLELKTERVKAKLATAEGNLERERDLLKFQGIKERDLDSDLGSWSWKP